MTILLKQRRLTFALFSLLALTIAVIAQFTLSAGAAYAQTTEKSLSPDDAFWTYKGTSVQAWARALEDDSGDWNFVIQTLDGRLLRDFHVKYEGIVNDAAGAENHVWGIKEMVLGFSTKISQPVGTDDTQAFKNAVAQLSSYLRNVSPELANFVASVASKDEDELWQLFDSGHDGCD